MIQLNPQQNETIDAIVRILGNCRSLFFVTGAGVSADSGVPTYRGIGGLYDVDVTEEGLPIEEVLSGPMFQKQPELTWKYLGQIAEAARGATHNRTHQVIAEMEQHFARVWTLTQNVDGFHRSAGSSNVIEIHGNMRSLSCTSCSYSEIVDENTEIQIPPYCPKCQAIVRPDVVLFEEMLPERALTQLYEQAEKGFDAVFTIGTSSVFPYIQQPVLLAKQMGIPTIEINPTETLLSAEVDYRLALGAADVMDEIWKRYQESC
ncbi:MAG: NAD-dependent protein deacylase [Blastopirellula sp.]|nr:MAG: NAD-dependent protein deacylase [Blastopirellula sp.]